MSEVTVWGPHRIKEGDRIKLDVAQLAAKGDISPQIAEKLHALTDADVVRFHSIQDHRKYFMFQVFRDGSNLYLLEDFISVGLPAARTAIWPYDKARPERAS
jgi:hypothetical protein